MKRFVFATDAPEHPLYGIVIDIPDKYATIEEASDAGCAWLGYLHGVGPRDTGNGSTVELKEYTDMATFNNGFNQVPDKRNMITARVQSPTGLYKGTEIPFLLAKIKSYKPKRKPALMGHSGGAFGTINNIVAGKLDPAELSSICLISSGGAGSKQNPNPPIGSGFAAKLQAAGCKLYLVHNENDTIARVEQSQFLFDQGKSAGLPVIFVKFKNVWTSSDGSTTSHAATSMVFPSWEWRMYTTDQVSRTSSKFAEVFNANGAALPCYDMYQRFIDDLPELPVPAPIPTPDKLITTIQVWQRADGSSYTVQI